MNAQCLRLLLILLSLYAVATRVHGAGVVSGWGDNNLGQLSFPPNLTNIISVASGREHSLAVNSDGTVTGWGQNGNDQLTFPLGLIGVRAVAAGAYHSVALRSNGTVVAWGAFDGGQTNVPAGLTGVAAIAAGDSFTVALRGDGTVVAWGSGVVTNTALVGNNVVKIAAGGSHALALKGSGSVVAWGSAGTHLNVPISLSAIDIAAGEQHSVALRADGVVVGWGKNLQGQAPPTRPTGGAQALFAGANHTGVIKNTGVICWGDNTYTQTNVPPGVTNVVFVGGGGSANHNLVVMLDRPAITQQPLGQDVLVGTDVAFVVGASGSPPLYYQWRKDGTNIPFANNTTYSINGAQLPHAGAYTVVVTNSIGSVTSQVAMLTVNSSPTITAQPQSQTVAVGAKAVFSVTAVGSPPVRYQWRYEGMNLVNQTNASYTNNNVQLGDAGHYTVLVTNRFGAQLSAEAILTVQTGPSIVQQPQSQAALAGSSVTLRAVVTNATTLQWRHNGTNVPGANGTFYAIDRAEPFHSGTYVLLASNAFGGIASSEAIVSVQGISNATPEVVLWGQDAVVVGFKFVDMQPPQGLANLAALGVGEAHNIALLQNGSVIGWGDNQYGHGGLPPTLVASAIAAGANHTLAITNGRVAAFGLNSSGQVTVPDISNVVAIAAGGNVSMALRRGGDVFVWGDNSFNQLVKSPSATNVMGIAAGAEHCVVVRSNGTVVAWGGNNFGKARPPFSVTNVNAGVAAVAAGFDHSLALKSNGTVIAWGRNSLGQTNVPPDATNIIAIVAGAEHSLALRADGAVFAWGSDNYGQVEPPLGLTASGVAAGADRSFAINRLLLKLFALPATQSGAFQFTVRNSDGTPVSLVRATNVDVYVSTNIPATAANWLRLTNEPVITNGEAIFGEPADAAAKFYRVQER